ncbi:MAG: type II secretion system protein [Phycisphaerae bacterium]|nr:type II secretion system protein [Phycisphaerae bacterium]
MARHASNRSVCRAFTLIELLVVIAIIALLVSILLPSLGEARRSARQAINISNQKNLVTATYNYGGDFKDKIASFTWQGGRTYRLTSGPNGATTPVTPGSDLLAAANQALDIIRRRAAPENTGIATNLGNWIPHPTYSHLVVMDFLSARMPEPMLVSPEDKFRQNMAETLRTSQNPTAYCMGLPGTNDGIRETWPYSSSYQWVPASYTPDREAPDGGSLRQQDNQIYYIYNAGTSNRYKLGRRLLTDVRFPAQKVLLMEDVGRHVGKREMPFLHPNALITVGMFDGQVRVIRMSDTNEGGYTAFNGRRASVAAMTYSPQTAWGYPLWPDGAQIPQDLYGRCRWTMSGLSGLDVGGSEVYVR